MPTNSGIVTETIRPAQCKIFTSWLFAENICQSCSKIISSNQMLRRNQLIFKTEDGVGLEPIKQTIGY